MDTATEIEEGKRELANRYLAIRHTLVKAAHQLAGLEDEYGFEYDETKQALRELREQLRVDESMALEFFNAMSEEVTADEAVAS
jgi:hypothetical protein